jgi:hypothetical protein
MEKVTVLAFINQHKPAIVAIVTGLCAASAAFGYPVPDWAFDILGACGLAAVHHNLTSGLYSAS